MNSNTGGIGLGGVVFVVFLILKLVHVIDWSWWWVAAPLWLPTLAVLGVALVAGIFMGIAQTLVGGKR